MLFPVLSDQLCALHRALNRIGGSLREFSCKLQRDRSCSGADVIQHAVLFDFQHGKNLITNLRLCHRDISPDKIHIPKAVCRIDLFLIFDQHA